MIGWRILHARARRGGAIAQWLSGSHNGWHPGEYPWTTLRQPGARRCCAEQGCRAHPHRSTVCPRHAWLSVADRRIIVGL